MAVAVAEPVGLFSRSRVFSLMELDFSTSAAVPSASPRLGRPALPGRSVWVSPLPPAREDSRMDKPEAQVQLSLSCQVVSTSLG